MSPLLIFVSSVVLMLDQLTKWLIRTHFLFGETRPVLGGVFHLTYYQNTGMAFGLMQGYSAVIAVFSVLAIGFLIYLSRHWSAGGPHARLVQVSLGLIVGGASGNLVDRVVLSSVVDFLDFGIGEYRWPAFNVADICISTGVGMLVLFSAQKKDLP